MNRSWLEQSNARILSDKSEAHATESRNDFSPEGNSFSGVSPYVTANARMPITLPPFWDGDADLWFVTVENIFRLHNITLERDRYVLTVGSLDLCHLQKGRYVLQDLHGDFPYSQLKEALIRAYSTFRSNR